MNYNSKKKLKFLVAFISIQVLSIFVDNSKLKAQTVTDIDGNVYQVVTINGQNWINENLKVTKFNDGTLIPLVVDNSNWSALTTPGYCYYGNNSSNSTIYGALYNWYTINNGNLCPTGWHVPSTAEFQALKDYIVAQGLPSGTAMKSTSGWNNGGNGTDNYGFTGLPSGRRNTNGSFQTVGTDCYLWSSNSGSYGLLGYNFSVFVLNNANNRHGFAVRCVSNAPLPIKLIEFDGRANEKAIELYWETASEHNNLGFEIQKLKNIGDWETIDFREGQGTTNEVKEYQFEDINPISGINYYRLKQIDFEGAFEYSKVIAVQYNRAEKGINVFPNPSNGLINLQINNLANQKLKIKVLDNMGRTIWHSGLIKVESNWKREIEINGNGIYFVITQLGNEIYYERVIITGQNN